MTGRELGYDALDDKVRARLAEIRAAAGVPHSQISLEVLYFLPKTFVEMYGTLFTRAVKSDGGESARAEGQLQAGELAKATGRGAKTNQKRYKRTFVVLDERALELKTKLDKRLRQMAREIELELSGLPIEKKARQCGSCGTFLQGVWKYCPMDGSIQASE